MIVCRNVKIFAVLFDNNTGPCTLTLLLLCPPECKVQGTDASDDLAVVKVALSDIKDSTLKEIKVATVNEDTDTLEVGQGVIAIGNALGYGQSVTNGIISA